MKACVLLPNFDFNPQGFFLNNNPQGWTTSKSPLKTITDRFRLNPSVRSLSIYGSDHSTVELKFLFSQTPRKLEKTSNSTVAHLNSTTPFSFLFWVLIATQIKSPHLNLLLLQFFFMGSPGTSSISLLLSCFFFFFF